MSRARAQAWPEWTAAAMVPGARQSPMRATDAMPAAVSAASSAITPTFTPVLLRKDMDLGLALGRDLGVPMPIAAATRELIQSAIGHGHTDCDFSILLHEEAAAAGLDLESEDIEVSDGLSAEATE